MSIFFFIIAIGCAVWGIISAMCITSYLSKQGVKINYLLIRILIIKYVHQYAKMTREKYGKSGVWYYSYIISMNLALIFVIIGLILKS
jgi:hypothetical protein